MTTFLSELGTKLADRWLHALVLSGLLWTVLVAAGLELGQDHPFALDRLSAALNRLATRPAAHATGTIVLAAAAVLLIAAGAGLAAAAGGDLVQRCWALPGDVPPASWLLDRRRRRWDTAAENLKNAIRVAASLPPSIDPRGLPPNSAALRAQAHVRNQRRRLKRRGATRPTRATRIGDRFALVATRAATVNGLGDLATAWPRLWGAIPEPQRTDISAARTAYTASARLASWGVLYILLAALWWPAALIGAAILAAASVQGRTSAATLAALIETTVDLHTAALARLLDLQPGNTPSETGRLITERLAGQP